jgi:ribosome-binding protein aMBF1 (putative translation factor)
MANRWSRYYERQMEDPEMKELVEKELENLRIVVLIARKREERHLSQTQLAARAGMSASKISATEERRAGYAHPHRTRTRISVQA